MNAVTRAPRIACFHFSNWPIQRLVAAQPRRRGTVLVLYREIGGRGRLVTAASPLAQRNGVRPGMPLAEAKSLVRRAQRRQSTATVPNDVELPADPAADAEGMQQLAQHWHQYSPLVGTADDSLLCEVSGVAELFGGEAAWLAQVLADVHRRGYRASAAMADTIGQAWALAHTHRDSPHSVIVPPGACWEYLDPLPPAALRVSSDICQTLNQLGIVTIGQLRRLPRASWAARFGDELARRIDQASGDRPEPIAAAPLPPTFAAEQCLEFPVREWETILTVIGRLLHRVCTELQSMRQGALAWRIRLWRQRSPVLQFRTGLFEPLSTAAQLIPLVRMQLEQCGEIVNDDEEAVTEIGVEAEQLTPLVEYQPLLFDVKTPRSDSSAAGDLINRLAIRLGPDRVSTPRRVAGAQPELAFRYEPLVGNRKKRLAPHHANLLLRPLQLFPHPLPIEVWGTADGPPATIACGNQRWTLAHCWGPERIETGWWRAPLVRRDYWRVETADRQWWWIYRDLKTGQWFWQGAF